MTLKLQRKYLPVVLVLLGSCSALTGLWLLGGLPVVLVVLGAAAVAFGLIMEV